MKMIELTSLFDLILVIISSCGSTVSVVAFFMTLKGAQGMEDLSKHIKRIGLIAQLFFTVAAVNFTIYLLLNASEQEYFKKIGMIMYPLGPFCFAILFIKRLCLSFEKTPFELPKVTTAKLYCIAALFGILAEISMVLEMMEKHTHAFALLFIVAILFVGVHATVLTQFASKLLYVTSCFSYV